MLRQRRKRGATLAFATVLALVLVVLGVGFFFFSMYMGAQNETKNATDAGALNVAKQVLSDSAVTYIITGNDQEEFFRDVTGNVLPNNPLGNIGDGKVTLTNINRIWAKALFVAVNADAAGSARGDTSANVQAALDGAQSITDRLVQKLTNETTLEKYFEAYSMPNSTRMLGTNTKVTAWSGDDHWETSLMDRGSESNIELTGNLPPGYNLQNGYSTGTKRKSNATGANNKTFLTGYTPLTVQDQTFWQVPFQFDGKPHLVSNAYFRKNQQQTTQLPEKWDKAVPNAFSVGGKVQTSGGKMGETAMSWVQTNPKQTFPMQFPTGFVRIVVKPNKVQWSVLGLPMDKGTYPSQMFSELYSGDGIPYPILINCSTVMGDAEMGMEYGPLPCVLTAINGIEPPFTPGSNNKAMTYLLQRCKEIDPTFTMANLCELLLYPLDFSSTDEQRFYLYGVGGKVLIGSDSTTPSGVGFDKDADPEGSEQWNDSTEFMGNFFYEYITCDGVPSPPIGPFPTPPTEISWSWKPGTGYQKGCLGELTVKHETEIPLVPDPFCFCPI